MLLTSPLIRAAFFTFVFSAHLIGDFFFQQRWMANNKSKSNIHDLKTFKPLAAHVLVYSTTLIVLFSIWDVFNDTLGTALWIAGINGVGHFCVDFITSKLTARQWILAKQYKEGSDEFGKHQKKFFDIIGIDQYGPLCHMSLLFITLVYFYGV